MGGLTKPPKAPVSSEKRREMTRESDRKQWCWWDISHFSLHASATWHKCSGDSFLLKFLNISPQEHLNVHKHFGTFSKKKFSIHFLHKNRKIHLLTVSWLYQEEKNQHLKFSRPWMFAGFCWDNLVPNLTKRKPKKRQYLPRWVGSFHVAVTRKKQARLLPCVL